MRLPVLAVTAVLALSACGTSTASTPPPTTPAATPTTPSWPTTPQAGPGAQAFPTVLPHWSLSTSWDDHALRTFTGQWVPMDGKDFQTFPDTMNGCDQQLFLIRWRALSPNARLRVGYGNSYADPSVPVQNLATAGDSGWIVTDGCGVPEWQFLGDGQGSTLMDLTVEVQQYVPAV